MVTSTVGSTTGNYTFDGSAVRVKKSVGTANTLYIFSGSKVIAEYEYTTGNNPNPASPAREYIYLGAQLLAKDEGGTLTYYHPDHLSNRVITNTSGSITAQSAHYPFGESWYDTTSGGPQKLKFTPYERDAEFGNRIAMPR